MKGKLYLFSTAIATVRLAVQCVSAPIWYFLSLFSIRDWLGMWGQLGLQKGFRHDVFVSKNKISAVILREREEETAAEESQSWRAWWWCYRARGQRGRNHQSPKTQCCNRIPKGIGQDWAGERGGRWPSLTVLVSRESRQEERAACVLYYMCRARLKTCLGEVGQRWRAWPRKRSLWGCRGMILEGRRHVCLLG